MTLSSIILKDENINSLIRFYFTEKERQHALNTQGQFQIPNHVCSTWKRLEYIWCSLIKLEEFVCHICGMQKKDVNEVRFVKYYSKYQNANKVVDISTLLPCWSVVHSKRANYFACILLRCLEPSFELPSIADHGWDQNANIWWIKEPFPKDIEEILMQLTMTKMRVIIRAIHSEFRRIEGELIQKTIWFTHTKPYVSFVDWQFTDTK